MRTIKKRKIKISTFYLIKYYLDASNTRCCDQLTEHFTTNLMNFRSNIAHYRKLS